MSYRSKKIQKEKRESHDRSLRQIELSSTRDRLPQQDGYVVVNSARMKRSKWLIAIDPENSKKTRKVSGFRIKVKIKDIDKPHRYRENDQNLGYISKKKYYGRFTTNPKTTGRVLAVIQQSAQAAPHDSEYMQIEGIVIETEYTEE
jgi:hypothetical protein